MQQTQVHRVARFLAEHRHIHQVFRSRQLPNQYASLDADLASLESAVYSEMPPLISEPYVSEYALYLESLPRHILLAHWFGLVYPYIQIPDQTCLVRGSVPDSWLETSAYFHSPDDLWARKTFEDEVTAWRPLERFEFFAESAEVYIRVFLLFRILLSCDECN